MQDSFSRKKKTDYTGWLKKAGGWIARWKTSCLVALLWAVEAVRCWRALGTASTGVFSDPFQRRALGMGAGVGLAMFLLFLANVEWFARASRLLLAILAAACLGAAVTGKPTLAFLLPALALLAVMVLLSREIAQNARGS
jgi:hypothetical protein